MSSTFEVVFGNSRSAHKARSLFFLVVVALAAAGAVNFYLWVQAMLSPADALILSRGQLVWLTRVTVGVLVLEVGGGFALLVGVLGYKRQTEIITEKHFERALVADPEKDPGLPVDNWVTQFPQGEDSPTMVSNKTARRESVAEIEARIKSQPPATVEALDAITKDIDRARKAAGLPPKSVKALKLWLLNLRKDLPARADLERQAAGPPLEIELT